MAAALRASIFGGIGRGTPHAEPLGRRGLPLVEGEEGQPQPVANTDMQGIKGPQTQLGAPHEGGSHAHTGRLDRERPGIGGDPAVMKVQEMAALRGREFGHPHAVGDG